MRTTTTPPEGVPLDTWKRIAKANQTGWVIAERDEDGEVIGKAFRSSEGKKSFQLGGNRGLIFDPTINAYAGASVGNPIFIGEGATDTAALLSLGFDAIGVPMAGACGEMLADFVGFVNVVVVSDADDAGRRGATTIAGILAKKCESVRIIEPPFGERDARDAVKAGAKREDFLALVQEAEAIKAEAKHASPLRTVTLADVQRESLAWLWPNRIPLGKLTLIFGDPGLGKSFLTLDVAARVSTGAGWPDNPNERCEPKGVLLLSAEDGIADTIRPRLDAAGADCSRIVAIESVGLAGGGERSLDLREDIRHIETLIQERDTRLLIIDPISAYCGDTDSHKDAKVRSLLMPLARIADTHGVAVVAVTHMSKGGGGNAIYRAMGSIAYIAAARAAWLVAADETDTRRRLFLPAKMNLARSPGGMAYTLLTGPDDLALTPCVAWEDISLDLTADDVLAADCGEERAERQSAVEWLQDTLTDGPIPVEEVYALGKKEGFTPASLRRVKKPAGVTKKRNGFGKGSKWLWVYEGAHEGAQQPPVDDEEDEGAHS